MADFSNIKFNGVEYGLKDRTSRQDINSLDERVTQVENKIPEILEFESFDALQAAYQADPTKFVEGITIKFTKNSYCDVNSNNGGAEIIIIPSYILPQMAMLSYQEGSEEDSFSCNILCETEEGQDTFWASLSFEGESYSYSVFIYRDESLYTYPNPLEEESPHDYEDLSTIRINNAFYKIPVNTSKVLKPRIIEFYAEEDIEDTAHGVWFYDVNDVTNNNELAKYLYYGLAPIACPYTEFDVLPEGVDECRPIAAGEIQLSYTTYQVRDFINNKSYNEGWGIQFKSVKTSPSDPDEYEEGIDLISTGLILRPYLVLDNDTPKIIFDVTI